MNTVRVIFVAVALLAVLSAAEYGYFWHITDTHIQSDYKVGSDVKEGCYKGVGKAGMFGDYKCRPPYSVEYSALMQMPSMAPDECPNTLPLFVVWTGDSVAMRNGVYSKEGIQFNIKNLTGALLELHSAFKGKVPIYPVIGNHDSYPQHQMSPTDDWVYKYTADLWEPLLPKAAVETLRKSGFYTVKVSSNLRLIVLNTILYYHLNNKTDETDKDPAGQIAWFQKNLEEAKKNHEAVLIAGHIPIRGTTSFRHQYIQPFLNAMNGYQDIIKGSFWGHHHVDTIQILGESTTNSHVSHLCGSISTQNSRNPTFRRYLLDTSKDYELLSWRTFYMDLPANNEARKIKWNTLFDSKTSYGLKDLTPSSVVEFAYKLEKDDNLFGKVWHHHQGGAPVSYCNATCRKEYVCGMLHTTPYEYVKCIKSK